MSETDIKSATIAFLSAIAGELAEIHRGRDYTQWRGDATHRVAEFLAKTKPFSEFSSVWVFSGDGAYSLVGGNFGNWIIDRLVEKMVPEAIIALFQDEVARNSAVYEDVSPVLGVDLNGSFELSEGIRIEAAYTDIFGELDHPGRYSWPSMPTGTGYLIQTCKVTPAFERSLAGAKMPAGASVTMPDAMKRDAIRRRFRLACLLASSGGVELPLSVIVADRNAVLSVSGTSSSRPLAMNLVVAFPADLSAIKRSFDLLPAFPESGSLPRAINRLGRSRLAGHPVDRALDLGMAAEIVLMHDHGTSNTEIAHKIGSRAAWLLGRAATDRATIFNDMKQLYNARSEAIHSGVLPSKSKIDLDLADQLVVRVVQAILELGRFPDWTSLVMGGEG